MLFKILVMFWNISRVSFSFSAYKTLRGIVTLFFWFFFQSCFSGGKFIPLQLCLFIKSVTFTNLCESFFISSWFYVIVTECSKHLLSFLLMEFVVALESGEENLYMIHHDSQLFYDTYNTIPEHN